MRKSERIRELEMKVAQMEVYLEFLSLSLNNLLESQGFNAESDLDSGKWYEEIQKNS
jgi:hypothetical protein